MYTYGNDIASFRVVTGTLGENGEVFLLSDNFTSSVSEYFRPPKEVIMMYTNIFDTHSHYADKLFNKDRMELLASLPENGVTRIMLAGCKVDDCTKSIQLAEQFPFVWCAVGIHPNWVNAEHETRDLEKITAMTSHEKVKAIGEIGLDYYRKDDNRELQKRMFCEQLELAKSLDLPVILHIREAMADGLEIVKEYRPKGVVHCWSGSVEMAKEFVKIGAVFRLWRCGTYQNARKVVETLQWIPSESNATGNRLPLPCACSISRETL